MDTPFPFPWAQAVNFVLMLFTYTLPFVVVAHTTGITVAVCITFAAVQTHVMLNEVCCPTYLVRDAPCVRLQRRLPGLSIHRLFGTSTNPDARSWVQ